MLELSPAITQCSHGAVVKLFCRYFDLVIVEPCSIRSKNSRPWKGRSQDELPINFDVPYERLSETR